MLHIASRSQVHTEKATQSVEPGAAPDTTPAASLSATSQHNPASSTAQPQVTMQSLTSSSGLASGRSLKIVSSARVTAVAHGTTKSSMQHSLLHALVPAPCSHGRRATHQCTHAFIRGGSTHANVQQQLQELLSCPAEQLASRTDDVAGLVKQVAVSLQGSPDWSMLRSSMRQMEAQYNADAQRANSNLAAAACPAQQWSWPAVTCLAVLGLGSISDAASVRAWHSRASQPGALTSIRSMAHECGSKMAKRDLAGTYTGACGSGANQGAPASRRAAFRIHQLALAISLQQVLPGLKHPPVFSDPAFSSWDETLIQALGCTVMPADALTSFAVPSGSSDNPSDGHRSSSKNSAASSSNSGGGSSSSSSTEQSSDMMLLYMPCCPRTLYADVVSANLQAGSLSRVTILGNSFRTLADSNMLLQALMQRADPPTMSSQAEAMQRMSAADKSTAASKAAVYGAQMGIGVDQQEGGGEEEGPTPELLLRLVSKKAYLELPVPDCAAHGVAVGLHAFPPTRVLQLQQ